MSKESTALEALNVIYNLEDLQGGRDEFWKAFRVIEKELKALEIIKDKKVNLEYLKCCENYEQYKTICSYWNEITQEEFDLLKEILK